MWGMVWISRQRVMRWSQRVQNSNWSRFLGDGPHRAGVFPRVFLWLSVPSPVEGIDVEFAREEGRLVVRPSVPLDDERRGLRDPEAAQSRGLILRPRAGMTVRELVGLGSWLHEVAPNWSATLE